MANSKIVSSKFNGIKRGKNNFITSQGLQQAKSELDYLINVKRQEIADRIARAREFGDITENSEYDAALEDQALTEIRILELEKMLKGVQIVKEVVKGDEIVVGSTVKLNLGGEVDVYTIVGSLEIDPAKKKISNESPLGAALLGAKIGETIEVNTPSFKYQCKIIDIN